MPKKWIRIKLKEEEEKDLKRYVSQGHKNARVINRARILLLANEGRKVKEIAQLVGTSQTTVSNVRKKYSQGGYEYILDVIQDEARSGRPIKFDSRVETKVSLIACSQPPVGRARWTLHMIADKLVKLEAVESISHESVRHLLKKTSLSPG